VSRKVAIIGAGYGGMAAAYDLARAGNQVTIFDSASQPGGLAAGFKAPGWDWSLETFYHHWFTSDRHILGLIDELGFSEDVLFPRPYTVMYFQGKFFPFDSIPAALLYPGLGWGIDKVRFGLVGLYLRLAKNWKSLEGVTVDTWMRRWAGTRVYEEMWQPMVQGKFGDTYSTQVNMAWLWARFHVRSTRLGTFRGGFQRFSDLFAEKLREMGVAILLSSPVSAITPVKGKYEVNVNGGSQVFGQVLSTTSPGLMAKMVPALPREYLQGLLALKSMGAVVLTLSLDRPLSPQGYYWYNIPKKAGFPFLSLVEHTNFLPAEHYGGDRLIYIGDYLEPDHEYFSLDADSLLDRFTPGIQRINPQFDKAWVKGSWVHGTRYAQPVPFVNHSRNIPPIASPLTGLFYASMSQVYPWDRGTNFAVEIGRRAARMMIQNQNTRDSESGSIHIV
jgi:protoporphyrinogen oxidase